jgi:Ca2+-binding EF-hand superfamily protein
MENQEPQLNPEIENVMNKNEYQQTIFEKSIFLYDFEVDAVELDKNNDGTVSTQELHDYVDGHLASQLTKFILERNKGNIMTSVNITEGKINKMLKLMVMSPEDFKHAVDFFIRILPQDALDSIRGTK